MGCIPPSIQPVSRPRRLVLCRYCKRPDGRLDKRGNCIGCGATTLRQRQPSLLAPPQPQNLRISQPPVIPFVVLAFIAAAVAIFVSWVLT